MTYAAFRLAAYDPIKELLGEGNSSSDKREFPLWKKILAGASAGAIGAVIANPTDVLKVRMQAAGKVKKNTHPSYLSCSSCSCSSQLYLSLDLDLSIFRSLLLLRIGNTLPPIS
jgi:solute carrier family 25 uncoupling protein 8/9